MCFYVESNVSPCADVMLWLCSCKEINLLCDRNLFGSKVQCENTLVHISVPHLMHVESCAYCVQPSNTLSAFHALQCRGSCCVHHVHSSLGLCPCYQCVTIDSR